MIANGDLSFGQLMANRGLADDATRVDVAEETGADGYVCKDEYPGSWVSDKLRENS